MFKVFTSDGRQYVGFSAKLAEDFYQACVSTGRCVMMLKCDAGIWTEVKEHVA